MNTPQGFLQDSLGDAIVDAVIASKAVEQMVKAEDSDALVFVWAANAQEQLEAAFLPWMENLIRKSAKDDDLIDESLYMLKIGYERGDPIKEVVRRMIAGFCLRMMNIDPNAT